MTYLDAVLALLIALPIALVITERALTRSEQRYTELAERHAMLRRAHRNDQVALNTFRTFFADQCDQILSGGER